MLFLEPLLELLFCDFMLIFCEKMRFGGPLATQLGPQIDLWADHFGQNVDFSLRSFMSETLLEPTWRPKGAQDAPQRPQGSNFTDLGSDLAAQGVKKSTERTPKG